MISVIGNSRRTDISFFQDGRIDISASITKLLHLRSGDVIDIAVLGSERLLYVSHRSQNRLGRHIAQCNPTRKNSNNFRAYSKNLCSFIFDECYKLDEKPSVARLQCGEAISIEGVGICVPIITRVNTPKK